MCHYCPLSATRADGTPPCMPNVDASTYLSTWSSRCRSNYCWCPIPPSCCRSWAVALPVLRMSHHLATVTGLGPGRGHAFCGPNKRRRTSRLAHRCAYPTHVAQIRLFAGTKVRSVRSEVSLEQAHTSFTSMANSRPGPSVVMQHNILNTCSTTLVDPL
jgi:hypothetical protein